MDKEESRRIEVSVIILQEEEISNFDNYVEFLSNFFSEQNILFEILIVSNGLKDKGQSVFIQQFEKYRFIKKIAFRRSVSQAVCVKAAVKEISGKVVLLCGSYQQIAKEDYKKIIDALDDETDMVCAWRQQRVDPGLNQLQSKLFNYLVQVLTGCKLHDLSCTTRVLKKSVLDELNLYGNMYRFLPVLAMKRGFRVKEVITQHYQERGKTGLYKFSDYFTRIVDIVTLFFNSRFSRKPMRFFSGVGSFFLLIGFFMFNWVFINKIVYNEPVGNEPLLLIASVSMVAGIQTAAIGLLGEVITFALSRNKKDYVIEKII